MSSIFISHSSSDNAAAEDLRARLEEQGHRSLFLDFDPAAGIQAGAGWERTLYTKLRACRAVVALCSEAYLASQWCFAEIALARMEGKEVFVLQIEPWSERARMPSILTGEQHIDLRRDRDEGYRRLWNGLEARGIVPAEARAWAPGEPPYPGLRAFHEEDAPIFFGRDEEIQAACELLNRARRQGHPRLVMVLGSSGSGKSSLVRAGILPRLRRDRTHWLVLRPFRPGRQPTRELAASLSAAFKEAGRQLAWEGIHGALEPGEDGGALAPAAEAPADRGPEEVSAATAREALLEALRAMEEEVPDDERSVVLSLRRLEAYLAQQRGEATEAREDPAPPAAGTLVELAAQLRLHAERPEAAVAVVIDQFEELLVDGDGHAATRFLQTLRAAVEEEGSPLLVIGTMRSDYLGVFQRSAAIQGLGFKSISVGPMSKDGLRRVIEGPARLGQIQLETGLVDLLLEDTGTGDALPLLAFTLRMMWDRFHARRLFEISEYRSFGGLRGAIARVADETFDSVVERAAAGPPRDGLARQVLDAFRNMAQPAAEGSGWTRKALSWNRLSDSVQSALVPFIDAQRLLVKRPDGTVEVAHEALFGSWSRLRRWLDRDREFLLWRNRLEGALEQWRRSEHDEGALLRGVVLAEAEEWLAARPADLEEERRFIEASTALRLRELQRRRRRRRRIFGATAAAALVCLGLAGWAVREQWISDRRADELHANLVVQTASSLEDPVVQALLLVESAQILPGWEPAGGARAARRVAGRAIPRAVLRGHGGAVLDAGFSPPDDGKIVTASRDGTARVWAASGTGRVVVLEGHEDEVVRAGFDPAGARVVTASLDGTARVWNADGSGRETRLEGHEGALHDARFSPDGRRVVTASADATARVWAADGGGETAILRGHEAEVLRARFAPGGGEQVLTASADGTARLWRPARPGAAAVIARHDDWVLDARFSPDGSRVVTASRDGLAKVCRVDGAAPCIELEGHTGWVWTALFSRDGRRVLTASADRTARVWSADGKGEPLVLAGHEDWVRDAAFAPDGQQVVTASHDGRARIWSLDSPGSFEVLEGHEGWMRRVAFSHEGARVITASDDGTVRVWRSAGPEDPKIVARHGDQVWTASFSADDGRIVTSSADLTAAVWDADTGKELAALRGHEKRVRSAEFSPDGKKIATAADDGTARIWDAADPRQPLVLDGHSGEAVLDVDWSRDGTRLVTAGYDSTASVWSVTGEQLTRLEHAGWVRSAVFSRDGRRVLTGSADRTARIWRADGAGEPVALRGHADQVMTAAFSSGEDRIVTSSADRTARIWPADGAAEAISLHGHEALVWSAAFSPDDSLVVTASQDGTARVWNADGSGAPIFLEGHGGPVWHAEFSHAGDRVVTASADGTARTWRLWRLEWPALVGELRQQTNACLTEEQRRHHLLESAAGARAGFARCERSNGREPPI